MENSRPKQAPIKEISRMYSIPEWTLRGFIQKNIIPYRKVRGRIYIPIDKFEKWLESFDHEPEGVVESSPMDTI